MTYRLNIPGGIMQENQNARETGTQTTPEDEEIPRDLYCPISLHIMVDPVMATDGHHYDRTYIERWLKIKRTRPVHSPVTGEAFPLPIILTPDFKMRAEVDHYLSKEDIERRNQYYRELERKKSEELKHEREPLRSLGISEKELEQLSSLEKTNILKNYLDSAEILLREAKISWHELIQADSMILKELLFSFMSVIKLMQSKITWQELINTNPDNLEIILRHSASTASLINRGIAFLDLVQIDAFRLKNILFNSSYVVYFTEKNRISFNDFIILTAEEMTDLLSDQSIIKQLIQEIGLTIKQWINLPEKSRIFLFDHNKQIQNLLQKGLVNSRFAQYVDLLEGILAHQEYIQKWFSEHPTYSVYIFSRNLVDIRKKLHTSEPIINLIDHPDQYLSYFEREQDRARFLPSFYQEISQDQRACLDQSFQNQEDKITFENEVMLPFLKQDHKLHFKNYFASIHNVMLLANVEHAPAIVSTLEGLSNCIAMNLVPDFSGLPESYLQFLSERFLDRFIQYRANTNFPITEMATYILFINYYLYDLIEQLQKQQHLLRTRTARKQCIHVIETIKSLFDSEEHCLIPATLFHESIPLRQFYTLLQQKTELIKKIASGNILHKSIFRRDSGLQIFCIILNVILMLVLPPSLLIFLPRLIMHCYNKNKYPNVLFLPEHPIAPAVKICQSQITDLQQRITRCQQTLLHSSMDYSIYAHNKSSTNSVASLPLPGLRL